MNRTCSYLDQHHAERCTECGVSLDICLCQDVDDKAHERLWASDGQTIRAIQMEIRAARSAFPGNRHLMAALVEEVGELAQALIQNDRGERTSNPEVFKEAVQVAAMAIRVAVEGDQSCTYNSDSILGRE